MKDGVVGLFVSESLLCYGNDAQNILPSLFRLRTMMMPSVLERSVQFSCSETSHKAMRVNVFT